MSILTYDYNMKLLKCSTLAQANPVSEMDESWLCDLPQAELCCRLLKHPEAHPPLQAYLTKFYPWLVKQPVIEPQWPVSLYLLPVYALRKLLLYIGVWYFSKSICVVIGASEVKKLKRSIGEEAYNFSLTTAPLILQSRQKKTSPLQSQAYKGTPCYFQRMGLNLLWKNITQIDYSARYRLLSKLPYSWCMHLMKEGDRDQVLLGKGLSKPILRRITQESLGEWVNILF